MKKPRIALFVADHTRDMPGIVLTAWELCRRGARCYLVPYRNGRDEIWALAPDFVLLPVMRPFQAQQARQFVDAGIQFGLLDTEGVVWSSMDEYEQTIWDDRELRAKARCICFWGPKVAEHTLSTGLFTREQAYVTGCPRFDYYVEPLASVYRGTANNGGIGRRSILINTNFTTGNLAGVHPDTVVDNYVSTYGFRREDVVKWRDNDRQAIDGMSELANWLASDFPEVDVILRPHPEEDVSTYAEKLSKLPNIRLTNSGYVAPWILSASVIIQRSCTTAIEAGLAGVPAISPQWIPAQNFYPIPESVSIPLNSYDETKLAVRQILDGTYEMPKGVRSQIDLVNKNWFNTIDGGAYRRVADAVLDAISSNITPDIDTCRRFLYRLPRSGTHGLARIGDKIRYKLGLSPGFAFSRLRAFDNTFMDSAFNENNISGLLEDISRELGESRLDLKRVNRTGDYICQRFRGRALAVTSI